MYFTYAPLVNDQLPYQYFIENNWLSVSVDLDKNSCFGYVLGTNGGNYVKFTSTGIEFSYHKDFKLFTSPEIILTNLNIEGIEVNNEIVFYGYDGTQTFFEYPLMSHISYDQVLSTITDLLLENIKTLISDNTRIAYTAGLDSSLIAYLAHTNKIEFTAVVPQKYQFKNLPFKAIEYFPCLNEPKFNVTYGPLHNVKPGFYQEENNNLLTGYYGDLCALHHNTMYHQSKHLFDKDIVLYDTVKPESYPFLNSKEEILNCVKYLNTQNYFRHWFDDFQILDPYRDPRIFLTICQLPLNDLIEQLGSAKLQKDIIRNINPDFINNLCDYKNNYEKFR